MKRFVLVLLAIALTALVAWVVSLRHELRIQWDCYQVTRALDYEVFQHQLQQFLQESPVEGRLRSLLARWHTGNETFDGHLVRYLYDPQCSEEIREAFSLELSWRPSLLAAWAEHWRQRKDDVEDEMASIRRYLEALHASQPPRSLTWRDVLDLQAALELSGQGDLAHRLTPDNWRLRFPRWTANAD